MGHVDGQYVLREGSSKSKAHKSAWTICFGARNGSLIFFYWALDKN